MREICTTWGGKEDLFALCESGSELGREFVKRGLRFEGGSWYGGVGHEESLRRLTTGDNSLVAESDRLMRALEDQVPLTKRWKNVDDVVGGLPNVPAYLAGTPINMRRRVKLMREDAPISVFVDLTSSAGIDAERLFKRGTAILAFVRLLTEHRAVELWAGIGLNSSSGGSSMIGWRIDTAPLDLARSAHLLCSPSVARGLGYKFAQSLHRAGGSWPFRSFDKHKASGEERLRAVLGTEIKFIPPIFVTDELVTAPVKWIKRELARYMPKDSEAA